MRLPIRARLTLIFASLMLVVLAGSGAFLYLGLAVQMDAAINSHLGSMTKEVVDDIEEGDSELLNDFGIVETGEAFAQILSQDGRILDASYIVDGPLLDPAEFDSLSAARLFDRALRTGSDPRTRPARLLVTPIKGRVVIVGITLEERNATLGGLAILLWAGGPVFLMITSGLAWFLSSAALRPVERIRRETAAISEEDLEKRLRVPATGDEIAKLATTLNQMLARLEQAFERERRFVDDASHELRTPLAILKAELELALRRSRTKTELTTALASAAEESQRLSRLAENLLVLARSSKGSRTLHRTRIDAATLVGATVDLFQLRAREHGVTIEVSVPRGLEIKVDELRLQQALGNLIDNAVTHTPHGGSVRITVAMNAARELTIMIADTGSGFPDAFIDRAFDPFARANAGRSQHKGGAGLGLAIVKDVVEAHGGSVEARNQPEGGAIVALRLLA